MEDFVDSFEYLDDAEELKAYVEENGVLCIGEVLKERLEKWKDIEVNIGITGDSGTGKSSFINAIRDLEHDDDPGAAKVGVTETTTELQSFPHPTNEKIKFWDLPGIGTPNYPNLETYSEKVKLETYDTFLLLTAGRFTENDLILAKKIRSVGKKFFFIRTKIDNDVRAERRKRSSNEEIMLAKIRHDCSDNLTGLVEDDLDIFLISNHYPTKWEFGRLTQSILDVFGTRQREALTLSLDVLTSMSADILKRKIEVLRSRVLMVSGASAAAALVPVPGLSIAVDLTLVTSEVSFYRSQLGLPEEGSALFNTLTADNQEKVRRFFLVTAEQVGSFIAAYSSQSTVEEWVRFIPFVGQAIASGMSFGTTYNFLHRCLTEMEKTALSLLDAITAKTVDDFDID